MQSQRQTGHFFLNLRIREARNELLDVSDGVDTFAISRPRTRALRIETRFVVGRLFSKVPVIKVLSRSACVKTSIVVILLLLKLSQDNVVGGVF